MTDENDKPEPETTEVPPRDDAWGNVHPDPEWGALNPDPQWGELDQ